MNTEKGSLGKQDFLCKPLQRLWEKELKGSILRPGTSQVLQGVFLFSMVNVAEQRN